METPRGGEIPYSHHTLATFETEPSLRYIPSYLDAVYEFDRATEAAYLLLYTFHQQGEAASFTAGYIEAATSLPWPEFARGLANLLVGGLAVQVGSHFDGEGEHPVYALDSRQIERARAAAAWPAPHAEGGVPAAIVDFGARGGGRHA